MGARLRFAAVIDPTFRMVVPASALDGTPAGWTGELLGQGEMALAVDEGDGRAIERTGDGVDRVEEAPPHRALRRDPRPPGRGRVRDRIATGSG